MPRQEPHRVSEFVVEPAEMTGPDATIDEYAHRVNATPGLSAHLRQLRNRNQGISRWLVLAIFTGAVVALAIVQFAIR
jgi:hypothetical protein